MVGCGRDDFSTLDAILSLGTAEKARVVRDSLHEANRRSRKHRFSRHDEAIHQRCAQTVCYFRKKVFFFGAGGSPLQARRRLWCATVVRARGCRAGVSARSPSEMGKKAKGKHRLGACPLPSSPNRAPARMRPRRFLGTAAAGADSEEKAPMTRAPTSEPAPTHSSSRAAAVPRRRVAVETFRSSRFVPSPLRASPRPPRPNATPILIHRRSSSSCPIRHRQVLLPGEGAGLPLARVVQARAAEPQV